MRWCRAEDEEEATNNSASDDSSSASSGDDESVAPTSTVSRRTQAHTHTSATGSATARQPKAAVSVRARSVAEPDDMSDEDTAAQQVSRKAAPTKAGRSAQDEDGHDSIFDALTKRRPLDGVVRAVLQRYSTAAARNSVKVELLNLVFRASGGEGNVASPSQAFDDLDIAELAALFSETMSTEDNAVAFPLEANFSPASAAAAVAQTSVDTSDSAKATRSFRDTFAQFWATLIDAATADALFGEESELADLLNDVLISLSSARLRNLRHTASFAAMHVGRALTRKSAALRRDLASVQQQIRTESSTLSALISRASAAGLSVSATTSIDDLRSLLNSLRDDRAQRGRGRAVGADAASSAAKVAAVLEAKERVVSLGDMAENIKDSIASADVAADSVHKGVFAHRYRDVSDAIRADMLAIFSGWMLDCPDVYLTNTHLKYVGWMLHDAHSASVRAIALATLVAAYQLPDEHSSRLTDFMQRFRGRIAEMLRDVDPAVARTALSVLHCALLKDGVDVPTVTAVREALLSQDGDLRRAAARFLLDQLPVFAAATNASVDDDAGEPVAPVTGRGRGAKNKSSTAAGDKAAAEASARARRARAQLRSLLETAVSLLDPDGDAEDSLADDHIRVDSVMEVIASAFWAEPAAAVLINWDAYTSLLLNSGAADTAMTATDSEIDVAADAELGDLRAKLCLRLLLACAMRAAGTSVLDGEVGVPSACRDVASTPAAGALSPVRESAPIAYLTRSPDAIERSRELFTAALLPALPDLFVRYGGLETCAVLLCSIVTQLSPTVFGSTGASKAFADLLYQLSRLVQSVHVRSGPLSACALAFAHVAQSGHSKTREAEAAARKVVAALMQRYIRAADGILAHDEPRATAIRGAQRGGARSRDSASMESLAVTLRRIHTMVEFVGAGALVPELEDGGDALRMTTELISTICNTSVSAGPSADRSVGYAVVQECTLLLVAVFALRLHDVTARARESSDMERSAIMAAASQLIKQRNGILYQALQLLALRHGSSLADDASSVEKLHTADDIIELDSLPFASSLASYGVPATLSAASQLFLHRCRMAGFAVLVQMSQLCAPATLDRTALRMLAWTPSEDASRIMAAFVNNSLGLPAAGLRHLGINVPASVGDHDDDALHAHAGSEQTAAASTVDLAKACHVLLPLSQMSLAAPGAVKLGHLLGRRVLESENEAGATGAAVVKHYIKVMKEFDTEGLLLAQLHSIQESCKALAIEVQRLRDASADADSGGDEDAEAALDGQRDVVEQFVAGVVSLVRRQAQNVGVGKAGKTAKLPLVRMLQRGVEDGMKTLPQSGGMLFALLSLYVPLVPADVARKLVYDFTKQRAAAHLGRDEAESILAATTTWLDKLLATAGSRGAAGRIPAVDLAARGAVADGFSPAELLPYASLLFFLRSASGVAVKNLQATAQVILRLQCGLAGGSLQAAAPSTGGRHTASAGGSRQVRTRPTPSLVARGRSTQAAIHDGDDDEALGAAPAASQSTRKKARASAAASSQPRPLSAAAKKRRRARAVFTEDDDEDDEDLALHSDEDSDVENAAIRGSAGRKSSARDDSQLVDADSDEISLVRRPTTAALSTSKKAPHSNGTPGGSSSAAKLLTRPRSVSSSARGAERSGFRVEMDSDDEEEPEPPVRALSKTAAQRGQSRGQLLTAAVDADERLHFSSGY